MRSSAPRPCSRCPSSRAPGRPSPGAAHRDAGRCLAVSARALCAPRPNAEAPQRLRCIKIVARARVFIQRKRWRISHRPGATPCSAGLRASANRRPSPAPRRTRQSPPRRARFGDASLKRAPGARARRDGRGLADFGDADWGLVTVAPTADACRAIAGGGMSSGGVLQTSET